MFPGESGWRGTNTPGPTQTAGYSVLKKYIFKYFAKRLLLLFVFWHYKKLYFELFFPSPVQVKYFDFKEFNTDI